LFTGAIGGRLVEMADRLVLINGLPGSGKTTLTTGLAQVMALPVIAKDGLKEAIADAVPAAPVDCLGRVAASLMWTLAAAIPGTVLVESWLFTPRDLPVVTADVRRCAVRAIVEVWCDVGADVAYRHCEARRRHPVQDDSDRRTESWPLWAAQARPLGIGTTVHVRTDRQVDHAAVARQVSAALHLTG
jgi:shikimate kinase